MPNKLKLQNRNEATGKTHIYEASWGWESVEADNENGDVDVDESGENKTNKTRQRRCNTPISTSYKTK